MTPCFGILLQSFVDYQFPIDVKFDTQKVGGPSAGLAFTLAIIDDLTPGDLTGGKRVAVTGTIAPDGTVGPVGGVEQKAITARHNGVDADDRAACRARRTRARGAGDMRVVPRRHARRRARALAATREAPQCRHRPRPRRDHDRMTDTSGPPLVPRATPS